MIDILHRLKSNNYIVAYNGEKLYVGDTYKYINMPRFEYCRFLIVEIKNNPIEVTLKLLHENNKLVTASTELNLCVEKCYD